MAMFRYNPTKPYDENNAKKTSNVNNTEYPNGGWIAKLCNENGEDKLVVWEADKEEIKYYVDEFNNCSGFELKDEKEEDGSKNIWYSFNPEYNDFHIVPDLSDVHVNSDKKDYYQACKEIYFEEIRDKLKTRDKLPKIELKGGPTSSNSPWVLCHQYKYADVGNYQYLISFNRLWCKKAGDNEYHIHNNFGQVQFARYRIKCDNGKEFAHKYQNINWGVGPEFKMMYPTSGKNYDYSNKLDEKSRHIVYNAPFELKTIVEANGTVDFKSEKTKKWAEKVANAFVMFIEIFEEPGVELEKQLDTYKNRLINELNCPAT